MSINHATTPVERYGGLLFPAGKHGRFIVGERIGRALIGLDFPSSYEREAFLMTIPSQGEGFRLCEPVDPEASARLTSSGN